MAKEQTQPDDLEYFDLTAREEGDLGDPDPTSDPEPEEGSPEAKKEPEIEPKNDPSRMEYWQSVADKRERRLKELEPLAPLGKILEEDPEIINVIEERVAKRHQPQGPQKPEPPAKPGSYDEAESIINPESESFKYRLSLEDYRAKLFDFYEQRDAAREAAIQAEAVKRKALEAKRMEEAKLRTELAAKGLQGDDVDKFIETFSSPGNVKLDHLVELYRSIQSSSTGRDRKADDLQRRKERQGEPSPVGAEGGEPDLPEQTTEQDAFNRDLLKYKAK